jgi:hypothetical protein
MDLFSDGHAPCPLIAKTTEQPCRGGAIGKKGTHVEKCHILHIGRHDYLAQMYTKYTRDQGIWTKREQLAPEINTDTSFKRPGDIVSTIKIDGRWGELWKDFGICSEIKNTYSVRSVPLERVLAEEKKKLNKYSNMQFQDPTTTTFLPVIASTCGAWAPLANKAFEMIAAHVADFNLSSTNHELVQLRRYMTTVVMKRIASDIRYIQGEVNHNPNNNRFYR